MFFPGTGLGRAKSSTSSVKLENQRHPEKFFFTRRQRGTRTEGILIGLAESPRTNGGIAVLPRAGNSMQT